MFQGGGIKSLVLYTTIYPGVEAFLPDWYRSVRAQSDSDFALWIGLDTLTVDAAIEAMGGDPIATWVLAAPGETPAQIRQRAFAPLVDSCEGVVLVDSDDILHPSRVAAARTSLLGSDLAGCALRLVDQEGGDLGESFGLPPESSPEQVLPRNNVFGLSNTAFRSNLLQRCLPIPAEVVLVDWFLATRAWLLGAKLAFDPVERMDYRQHGANMARVRPPFATSQVINDCERVRRHFQLLLAAPLAGADPARLAEVETLAAEVEIFYRQVVLQPLRLARYLAALNELMPAPLWWSSVAHPALQHLWMPLQEEQ